MDVDIATAEDFDRCIDHGLACRRRQDFSGAIAEFREACVLRPESIGAQCELAFTCLQAGALDDAWAGFTSVHHADAANVDALVGLGLVARQHGGPAAALEYFQRAAEQAPDHAGVRGELAFTMQLLGRLDEAEALYRSASEADPASAAAWQGLSTIAATRGDIAAALGFAQRACAIDPANLDGRVALCALYRELGQAAEAMLLAEKTLALAPGHAGAWIEKGRLLRARGDRAAALAAFRHAADSDPARAGAEVAVELLALGRADAAREQYSGMLAANPDDLSAMLGLAEIELLAGDGDACIARCDAAAAVHPQQASAYRMKCRALLQLGRADAARRVADQAGALLRNSIEATLLRLDVLRSCGDRAALALLAHPPFAETTEVACWLEVLLTRLAFFDLDGAAAMLDRPPVLRPSERARALSAAGQLAELQWRIADAIGCYERAIDIQPVDPGTHHALARLHLLRADAGRAAAHLRTATEQSGSALALRGQSSNASQNLVGQLLNELRLDPPMGAQLASLADDAPLRQVERLREIVAANPAATPPALCLMRALREAGAFAARDAF